MHQGKNQGEHAVGYVEDGNRAECPRQTDSARQIAASVESGQSEGNGREEIQDSGRDAHAGLPPDQNDARQKGGYQGAGPVNQQHAAGVAAENLG